MTGEASGGWSERSELGMGRAGRAERAGGKRSEQARGRAKRAAGGQRAAQPEYRGGAEVAEKALDTAVKSGELVLRSQLCKV